MISKEDVMIDFEPMIERELKYRRLVNRLMKLGSPNGHYDDFIVFFTQVCKLWDVLNTVKKLQELEKIVKDSEFLFGKPPVTYMLRYLKDVQ